jgi:hypothetical protein
MPLMQRSVPLTLPLRGVLPLPHGERGRNV